MSLLDVLFPADCVGCGARGAPCCARCRSGLDGRASLAWPRPSPPGLPTPWAVAEYSGHCRDLLLAYKERGVLGLRGLLAVPLAASLRAAAAERSRRSVLVVPVPSSRRAIRERGDDVVLDVVRRAASIARRDGTPVRVVRAIRHNRSVADSAGLGATARATNLAGAFTVRRRLHAVIDGAEIVIADDLITTGATIAEAARALRGSGASVLGAAAIAATQRRGDTGLLGATGNGATVDPYW